MYIALEPPLVYCVVMLDVFRISNVYQFFLKFLIALEAPPLHCLKVEIVPDDRDWRPGTRELFRKIFKLFRLNVEIIVPTLLKEIMFPLQWNRILQASPLLVGNTT